MKRQGWPFFSREKEKITWGLAKNGFGKKGEKRKSNVILVNKTKKKRLDLF